MNRLTFEGNFCDIAMCRETSCENGPCSQKKVWERLKRYEDIGLEPDDIENRLFENMHREHRGDIPKEQLDELIRLLREYWESAGSIEHVVQAIEVAQALEKCCGPSWLYIKDLVCSIVATSGFKKDASNEDIYAVLAVLGWEVK